MREWRHGIPYHFEYPAFNGLPAVCELRVYQHTGKTIVVASDVDVGPPLNNNLEIIATLLRQQGIRFDLFIEHYDERPLIEECFDWVTFTWQDHTAINIQWRNASREEVEAVYDLPTS